MPARIAAAVLALTLVATACDEATPPPAGPAALVVYDGAVRDERAIVAPGALAAQLGLREGGVRPIPVDIRGDPGAPGLTALAADPTVVGAIVAPFTHLDVDAWASLRASGLPVLSLSQTAPTDGITRSFVPDVDATAIALEAEVGSDACMIHAVDEWAATYAAALLAAGPPGWGASPTTDGCDGAIWGGPSAVAPAGPAGILLTDQARTTGYLQRVGPAAATTPAGTCGCVDTGSRADPALQAFVHAYQDETGLDPGPYGAEAYDAAHLLVAAWRDGADRAGAVSMIEDTPSFRGAAGTYRWEGPALASPAPVIYRPVGYRWVAV